jgi:cytochrome c-type biogenesis protein CcmH/NrfG
MPPRFCPECGTPAIANAKFCTECGTSLRGGAPATSATAATTPATTAAIGAGGWQLTTPGLAVFALFVVGGLGIWAAVLSPSPPTPGPGRGVARTPPAQAPSQAMAQADLPPDHPKVPMQVPAEVKTFIDDLAKKASAAPKDVGTWSRLAQVYYRTAQVDSSYYDDAKAAFEHVLELEPQNLDALRGLGSIHFELDEPTDAIAVYGRYLALKPDDDTVRTALGAAHVSSGDLDKGIAIFRDVIAKKPDAWPAHYYLGVALDQQGDHAAGLASIKRARALATEDNVRAQIDDTIARLSGGGAPPPSSEAPVAARTPFQTDVEKAFRDHQIMGPRIVRFEWTAPGTGRVVVQNFPMSGMPDAVKQKFTARLSDVLRDAAKANPPGDTVKIDIADAGSGEVMATVVPST